VASCNSPTRWSYPGVRNDEQDVRCSSGRPTATTHPDLDPIIAAAHSDDPVAAAAEYAGQFRSDPEGYLARKALDAAIVRGRYELPPLPDVPYVAFTDPSGERR